MVHNQYNDRLRAQGIDVDSMMKWLEDLLFVKYRGSRSREDTLAITCALEHFTSIGVATQRVMTDNGACYRAAAFAAHRNRGCRRGLNPPDSSSARAM